MSKTPAIPEGKELMKFKGVAIQSILFLWFSLVFVVHYFSLFNNVLRKGAMQVGILGAITSFFKDIMGRIL